MLLTSQRITNMFGAVGYSVLLVNYALVAAIVLWWLIQSGHGDVLGIPPAQETPVVEELADGRRHVALVVLDEVRNAEQVERVSRHDSPSPGGKVWLSDRRAARGAGRG